MTVVEMRLKLRYAAEQRTTTTPMMMTMTMMMMMMMGPPSFGTMASLPGAVAVVVPPANAERAQQQCER